MRMTFLTFLHDSSICTKQPKGSLGHQPSADPLHTSALHGPLDLTASQEGAGAAEATFTFATYTRKQLVEELGRHGKPAAAVLLQVTSAHPACMCVRTPMASIASILDRSTRLACHLSIHQLRGDCPALTEPLLLC